MRQFDYTKKWKKMLTPEIVRYLTTIHEYKGEQRLIAEHHADVLESLVEVAKIQSTESSNKIEGKIGSIASKLNHNNIGTWHSAEQTIEYRL